MYDDYAEEKPRRADLVGVWELNQETREYLVDRHGLAVSTHRLILHDSGALEVVNMPNCWALFDEGSQAVTFCSGRGSWWLSGEKGDWRVWLRFVDAEDPQGRVRGTTFVIRKQRDPRVLMTFMSDPDLNQILILERTSAKTP